MTESVVVLQLSDRERWTHEWQREGLPSQSWEYAWGLSASNITPQLAIVEAGCGRMLLPFFEREWEGTVDIASIPCLSGASILPGSVAPFRLWRDYAASRGWIAGYIQLAPMHQPAEGWSAELQAISHNSMFLLDVQSWDMGRTVSRTIRRRIASVEASGARLIEDKEVLSEALKILYPVTMRRVNGREMFSAKTLERWAMSPTTYLVGAAVGNAVEAVHLGHVSGTTAEWHLAATSDGQATLGTWLYCKAIPRLRERGVQTLNLGGGVYRGDGIGDLKRWLGGVEVPLNAVHQVYDAAKYASLCESGAAHGTATGFPAYRYARDREATTMHHLGGVPPRECRCSSS